MSKLNKLVQCKLSEDDYNKYLEKVHESGYNQSEYFRYCVLTNKTEIVDKTISNNLIRQLAWIGNNLNQVAHVLNSQRKSNTLNSATWEQIIDELQVIRDEVISLKEVTFFSIGKSDADKS